MMLRFTPLYILFFSFIPHPHSHLYFPPSHSTCDWRRSQLPIPLKSIIRHFKKQRSESHWRYWIKYRYSRTIWAYVT
jgi:hypothetical protein